MRYAVRDAMSKCVWIHDIGKPAGRAPRRANARRESERDHKNARKVHVYKLHEPAPSGSQDAGMRAERLRLSYLHSSFSISFCATPFSAFWFLLLSRSRVVSDRLPSRLLAVWPTAVRFLDSGERSLLSRAKSTLTQCPYTRGCFGEVRAKSGLRLPSAQPPPPRPARSLTLCSMSMRVLFLLSPWLSMSPSSCRCSP